MDARSFAGIHGVVPGAVIGPIPSADGKALQTIVWVNVGTRGFNGTTTSVDSRRAIAGSRANGLAAHVTGILGNAADTATVFKGLTSTLLYVVFRVVPQDTTAAHPEQLPPLEHGVGGVRGAEHRVRDPGRVDSGRADHGVERRDDAAGHVRRDWHLDLGTDLIGAAQDHGVGVRPSDIDAEPIIKC